MPIRNAAIARSSCQYEVLLQHTDAWLAVLASSHIRESWSSKKRPEQLALEHNGLASVNPRHTYGHTLRNHSVIRNHRVSCLLPQKCTSDLGQVWGKSGAMQAAVNINKTGANSANPSLSATGCDRMCITPSGKSSRKWQSASPRRWIHWNAWSCPQMYSWSAITPVTRAFRMLRSWCIIWIIWKQMSRTSIWNAINSISSWEWIKHEHPSDVSNVP